MAVRKDARRGVWVIDFWYPNKSGVQKRYRKDSQAKTRKDAVGEETRLMANVAIYGSPFAPAEVVQDGAIPFRKAVDEFRVGMALTELKASTRRGYNEILDSVLLPRFAKESIGTIDYAMVQKMDAEYAGKVSASRRRNIQITLRTVLGTMVDMGRLKEVPKLPQLPRVGRTVTKVLTFKQIELILANATEPAVLPISISAQCGLRSGEIRALRRPHLDLVKGWITVEESVSYGEVDSPKSGHQRKVPIPNMLLGLLRLMDRNGKLPKDIICLNNKGVPWAEHGLGKAFQRAAAKAGIEGFTFHSLRHFYVTTLFRSGVPAHTVQAMAGHEGLATTQRYAHSDELAALDASERFSNVLNVGGDAGSNENAGFDLGNIWETEPSNDDPHKV